MAKWCWRAGTISKRGRCAISSSLRGCRGCCSVGEQANRGRWPYHTCRWPTRRNSRRSRGMRPLRRWSPREPSILVGLLLLFGILPPICVTLSYGSGSRGNTPDLASDDFASAEVQRQITRSRQALRAQFDALTKVGIGSNSRMGLSRPTLRSGGNLPKIVSQLCSDLYPLAPRVTNELVNRNALSSAAASARMRLIEGMFESPRDGFLGIDERKSPPEKSMYLSVLQRGALHVAQGDGFVLQTPPASARSAPSAPQPDRNPKAGTQGPGCRVQIADILATLAGRPYGVRNGLAPILLALVIKEHGHELALYENGTFLPKFGAMEFLRLTKAPQTFEIQHCSVKGVRSDVFVRLASLFATGVEDAAGPA